MTALPYTVHFAILIQWRNFDLKSGGGQAREDKRRRGL